MSDELLPLPIHPSEPFDLKTIDQLKSEGWIELADLTSDQLSDSIVQNSGKTTREFFNAETNRYTLMVGPETPKLSVEIGDIRNDTALKAGQIYPEMEGPAAETKKAA